MDEMIKAPVEDSGASSGIDVHEDAGSVHLEEYINARQIEFREALEQYDFVSANYDPNGGSFVVLAERNPGMPATTAILEMGYTSPSPYTSWTREEWNPKLRGKLGIHEYYKMKRQDGIVRGVLRLMKTPIQAGHWFVEPASDSVQDKNLAKFVEDNLFNGLNVSWSRVLDDILLSCEYGFMPMEKVYGFNQKGQVVLKKLAPRHPLDIQEWVYDRQGGPDGIIMEGNIIDGSLGKPDEERFIPIEKLAVFSLEPEAGDLNGISVLRSAYKHYYYKDNLYKIDAIQKERHGIGIPVIKLPPGYSAQDKAAAEALGRNVRTNDRAHIVLPPNWEFMFAKVEGNPVDCLTSIEHHNEMIMANILAPFLTEPKVDSASTDLYYKSTRYIGSTVCDVINKHVIPQLIDFNFRLGADHGYPQLRLRRVGEWEDLRTMSFAFRNFVGAGAIRPDDPLEKYLRREMDLPPADPDTARLVAAPQDPNATPGDNANVPNQPGPPQVGGPRQKATPTVNAGSPNTGNDKSGG